MKNALSSEKLHCLKNFTSYIWWKTPQEALEYPDRIIAQVMNIGTYEDVCLLIKLVGEDTLLHVLQHAEAGQFSERSWAYWHYRLTDIGVDEVPPMPIRRYHD